MSVSVEQLYKDFGVLFEAKDKAGEHEDEFLSILSAVKGSSSEKRLASQFIARFFKYFPGLALKAIDAQLDLCEDDDMAIRKQAIKDLPLFCRDTQDHLPRIADVLTQLLQSDDTTELGIVQCSLLALFKYDAKGALGGLFSQILQGEDVVRERAIKFLCLKLKSIPEEAFTPEVEEYLVAEAKKVLQDVTGDEFVSFMKILSSMKCMNTLKGRQQMVEIVTEQADLHQVFEPTDPDCVDRLMQCIRQALPFFSKNVHSSLFVGYMCDHVLPVLSNVVAHEQEPPAEGVTPPAVSDVKLELLKLFAEMSQYCGLGLGELQTERVEKLYAKLLEYMPLPPSDGDGENGESKSTSTTAPPPLQFSYVECLMYAFHQLGSRSPEFLTADENADKLKDFRVRLQYFARGVQVYIKQLRMSLQGKTGDDLKSEENKIKVVALKITNNINLLIKDLFHNPPSYKATITCSWKPVGAKPTVVSPGSQKRSNYTPITYEGGAGGGQPKKERKGNQQHQDPRKMQEPRKLYAPPTGRWSEKSGTYSDGGEGNGVPWDGKRNRGGYRGGFRGGYRGRGRGGFRGRSNRW